MFFTTNLNNFNEKEMRSILIPPPKDKDKKETFINFRLIHSGIDEEYQIVLYKGNDFNRILWIASSKEEGIKLLNGLCEKYTSSYKRVMVSVFFNFTTFHYKKGQSSLKRTFCIPPPEEADNIEFSIYSGSDRYEIRLRGDFLENNSFKENLDSFYLRDGNNSFLILEKFEYTEENKDLVRKWTKDYLKNIIESYCNLHKLSIAGFN